MKRVVLGAIAASLAAASLSFAGTGLQRPEETRQALYDLMNRFEASAPANRDVSYHAERVRRALDNMNPQQLEVLFRAYRDASSVEESLGFAPQRFSAVDADVTSVAQTDPVYSEECGNTRTDAATAQGELDTWQELQAAAVSAQGDCDAASSGDASADNATVCPVAAMAHDAALVARFAYENTLLCNRDIDSAEIDATLGTVQELQTGLSDLSEVPALIEAAKSEVLDAVDAHDLAIRDALDAHDLAVQEALALHDAEIKAMLAEITARQDTILEELATIKQLLVTPFGRRVGWNDRPENGNSGNNP